MGRAYALKAGEATTTAKKNLSVDGMAKIMVRHPSHDAYPSRRRGLFGISLTEAAQGSGGVVVVWVRGGGEGSGGGGGGGQSSPCVTSTRASGRCKR